MIVDMDIETDAADQLLCHHHWVPKRTKQKWEGEPVYEQVCRECGMKHRDYIEGGVRGALSRMGMWDEEDDRYIETDEYQGADDD